MKAEYPNYVRRSVSSAGRIVGIAVAIAGVVALFTACGSSSDTTTTAPATIGNGGTQVVMENLAFAPASVTIQAGETVTWTNRDSASHTVVGDNGEFQSGSLSNGGIFTFAFDKAGTYTYHCGIHPSMTGTVAVE